MYKIVYHKRAFKQLNKLPKDGQIKINKKIRALMENPLNPSLDVKRYYNANESWRIKVGNLRVIYRFDTNIKVVYIEYLGYRGDIYKH